ncbi:MAG: hypothetical protein C5B56_10380 [Proteobacteria bacterium]|nr:MAG: hypothetical protein C5B56_10380 [Pseudomonadota bacterium]
MKDHTSGYFVAVLLMSSLTWSPRIRAQEPREITNPSEVRETANEPASKDVHDIDYPISSGRTSKSLAKDFWNDQKDLWTSPARIRWSDTEWLFPFAGITAGLLVTDRQFSAHLSNNPSTLQHYRNLSTLGMAGLVGAGGGMVLWSAVSHDAHQRETGFLSGQAAVDSLLVVEALKLATQRERPNQGNGAGNFWVGGSSFPSEHAAAAWAVAGIIAHEYPGTLPKLLAYGLASVVSISRIKSREHFPSDVFVGSGLGWMIAQQVYSRHHDPELGGGEWLSFSAITKALQSNPNNFGSPFVPLDSWVYPAFDRLAGLGFIDTGFAGMRPWTRRECQRLVVEAASKLTDPETNPLAAGLIEALEHEFRTEAEQAAGDHAAIFRVESLYSRVGHISGEPLNDGYHFAQTDINDFGRPFGEGWNTVTGFSAYGTSGSWAGYIRGEWQTAGSLRPYPLAARVAIQDADFLPTTPPAIGQPSTGQFQLLDAYFGVSFSNWAFNFGRQSLGWGAGEGGSLTLSNNAAPINMFRITRTSPFKLPRFLFWLGEMKGEFFLGQLAGYDLVLSPFGFIGQYGQALAKQPFIHGGNISFKPTANFEFAFYRTTIYGGPGYPLTTHEFLRSEFSLGNTKSGNPNKPGDRTSGLEFVYRLPRMRNWVTFYGDAYTDDQFTPLVYADRSAWHAGLYFSHLPRLARIDLRVEGVYTDIPGARGRVSIGPGSFYFNGTWRSGYTNNNYLIGSWIGRGGQGAQAWTNYWLSSRNRVQLNFRHQKVSNQFIPNGGSLTDVGGRADYWVKSSLQLSAAVQYERWLFPVIQRNQSTNWSAAVQVSFQPERVFRLGKGAEENTANLGDRQ